MPTSSPTQLELFFRYMSDFEMAFVADQWSGVEAWFHDEATHVIHGGALPLGTGGRGRAEVIAGLRAGVDAVDRRFDARIPEIVEGPVTRPDGIWMRFSLELRRAGLPALRIDGDHLVRFRDGRIEALVEHVADGTAAHVAAYLDEHDSALRAAGSAFEPPPDSRDTADLEAATGRSLVRCYGGAKSEQDVEAVLLVCDDGFSIETVAFGVRSSDRSDTRAQLETFFAAFPDYRVHLEGFACDSGKVACWGRAKLTLRGGFLGQGATGRSADLPIFCIFELAGPTLARERFFFDLAAFCTQTGLDATALSLVLEAARETRAAA
ncbi:MAG TPA: nuclear transport factor 2 family protein [Candidatus Binatia bacterium]|jgi:predicted ester cyclase